MILDLGSIVSRFMMALAGEVRVSVCEVARSLARTHDSRNSTQLL